MQEIKSRSVSEHKEFSFNIERKNIKWLSKANRDFCREIKKEVD